MLIEELFHIWLRRCYSLLLHGLLLLLIEGVTRGQEARVGVCTNGSPEQQNEGLRLVNLIVNPPAGLLHTK